MGLHVWTVLTKMWGRCVRNWRNYWPNTTLYTLYNTLYKYNWGWCNRGLNHFSSFYFTLTDLSRTCVLVTFNTGKDDLELLRWSSMCVRPCFELPDLVLESSLWATLIRRIRFETWKAELHNHKLCVSKASDGRCLKMNCDASEWWKVVMESLWAGEWRKVSEDEFWGVAEWTPQHLLYKMMRRRISRLWR